jgi:methylthioribose-1-phosphate isomerase
LNVGDRHYRTIWLSDDGRSVEIIDQRWLPHDFRIEKIATVEGIATAIRDMWVRGAPLIGVTAAYGVAMQMADDASDAALDAVWETLHETRPTAINLRWALDEMRFFLKPRRSRRARNGSLPARRRDLPTRMSSSTVP